MRTLQKDLLKILKGKKHEIKENKIFFMEPPQNLHLPRASVGVMDKKQWSSWRMANYEYLNRKLAKLPDGIMVLDVGAGRSPFRELTERFHLVSVDFYPHELVDIVSDITAPLPLDDESFDLVILANVLEHVPDLQEVLSEAIRVLKPGGLITAITPFMMPIHEAPYEFCRPTSFMLEKCLSRVGFMNIEVEQVSGFLNAYWDIERDFSNAAIASQPKGTLYYFLFRFWRKMNDIILKLARSRLDGLKDSNYPHGYGFSATKPLK